MKQLMLVFSFSFVVSCSYETIHSGVVDNSKQGGEICNPTGDPVVTYETLKSEIFSARCFACHSSATRQAGGVALDTYVNATRWARSIQTVTANNLMPPNPAPPLSPDEKAKIDQWILSGMPESQSTDCTSPPPPQPPQSPTPPPNEELREIPPESEIVFSLVMNKIILPKCATCHSEAGGNRGRLNLESYSNVTDEIEDILEEVELGFMPPAPRPSLSQVEQDVLKIWFRNNMPQ